MRLTNKFFIPFVSINHFNQIIILIVMFYFSKEEIISVTENSNAAF